MKHFQGCVLRHEVLASIILCPWFVKNVSSMLTEQDQYLVYHGNGYPSIEDTL